MHPLLQSLGPKPRTGDVVACKVCGTEFYRQPAYIKQGRFLCTYECNKKWQARKRVTKTCKTCGVEFPVAQSEAFFQYCKRECYELGRVKRPTGRLHNGKHVRINDKGYVLIWEPEHPNISQGGWQFEHRLVVEQALGRYLVTAEQVDHINQDKSDNRIENLQVLDASSHSIKTNAENLGALKVLRERLAEYERRFGPLD
jgi:hypothetical protein